MQPAPKRKLIAFIDGFNLYYGLLREHHDRKWLDLSKLIRMQFPHYEITQIKYFTAEVDEGERRERQHLYWKALESVGVKIIPGKLETRFKACGAKQCDFRGFKRYEIPVEKRTDVNLAIHIITDARVMKPDAICIIGGDTDLIPAMEMVAMNYPCQRFSFIPCTERDLKFRRVDQFTDARWTVARLKEELVQDAGFAPVVKCSSEISESFSCPVRWQRKTP